MDASTHHRVAVDDGDPFLCAGSESVLEGMERLGRTGIQVGCRRGGCGVCKVDVVSGTYSSKRMSRAHVSADDERSGRVLSCRVYPTSDMVVRVVPTDPTATDRTNRINPTNRINRINRINPTDRTNPTTTEPRSASWL